LIDFRLQKDNILFSMLTF